MNKYVILIFFVIFSTTIYANPVLNGTYTGNITHNGSPLTYRITFKSASICSIQVVSVINGREVSQETEGTYSYDNTFFRVNAVFRNPVIPNINNIQWVSVASFNGENSFNIFITPDNTVNNQVRIVFIKEDISFSNNAIAQNFNTLSQNIPAGSRVAIVNIASNDADEGIFYINEITVMFVNVRRYTIVDRTSIDVVLKEQNFQMSGYVDDDSAVSIGKFLGANVVITGTISGTGARKRLVLKAISVLTAEILAMSSVAI